MSDFEQVRTIYGHNNSEYESLLIAYINDLALSVYEGKSPVPQSIIRALSDNHIVTKPSFIIRELEMNTSVQKLHYILRQRLNLLNGHLVIRQ